MKKTLLVLLVIVTAVMFSTSVFATALPWLDFGSNLIWNSNTNTLTDGGLDFVNSITYRDNTTTPPPPFDMAFMSPVSLSISFDGNNTNDYIQIGSWLSASLNVTGPTPNPLGASPNPYLINVSSTGLNVNTGAGSRWADEFD